MKRRLFATFVFLTVAATFAALTSWILTPGDASAETVYVTTPVAPLGYFPPVRAAIASNVDLTATSTTMDGITIKTGDRILVMGQTNTTANGIYVCTTYSDAAPFCALVRAPSAKLSSQMLAGSIVTVTDGTIYKSTTWRLTFSAGADASSEAGIIVGNSGIGWEPIAVPAVAPTAANMPCTAGALRVAANWLYVCTAANTWTRILADASF
jgi:hypothetical protein